MIRRLRAAARTALFLPPLIVGACSGDATGPRSERDGPLLAIVGRDELWLLNRGDEPVFTFVYEYDPRFVVDWVACADDARCPPLQPGAQHAVKFGRESGLRAGRRAVVSWWRAVPGPSDAPVPGPIRSFLVQL
jgi:hypothetical protein